MLAGIGAFPFDEPYQILNCMDYKNAPLSPLSAWIGGIYGELVDWRWIGFRYFAIACTAILTFISTLWMYLQTRNIITTIIVGVFSLMSATIFASYFKFYGWDNLTILLTGICLLVLIEYIRRPSIIKIVIMSVIVALSTMCRIPNIVLMPIIAIVLLCWHRSDNGITSKFSSRLGITVVFLTLSLGLVIGIISLLYGSPIEWLSYLRENPIDDHNIATMLYSLYNRAIWVLIYTASFGISYFIIAKTKNFTYVNIGACIIVIMWMVYLLARLGLGTHIVFFAIFILCIITILWNGHKARQKEIIFIGVCIFVMTIVPCIGSNTSFFKALTIPIFPIVLGILYSFASRSIKAFAICVMISVVLSANRIIKRGTHPFDGTEKATELIDDGRLAGMRTNIEEFKLINSVQRDIKACINHVAEVFVLRSSYEQFVFEYIYGARNPYIRHKFQNDGQASEYVALIEEYLDTSEKKIVLYFHSLNSSEQPMQEILDNKLYRKIERDDYTVYVNYTMVH